MIVSEYESEIIQITNNIPSLFHVTLGQSFNAILHVIFLVCILFYMNPMMENFKLKSKLVVLTKKFIHFFLFDHLYKRIEQHENQLLELHT